MFNSPITTKIRITPPSLIVYVLKRNKQVAKINCVIFNDTNSISIGDIQCEKNNKGYGSLMMQSLISYAKENNFSYIYGWLAKIDSDHTDRLYHFYEKFGFEITPNDDGNKYADIKLTI